MVDRDVITEKLTSLRRHLKRLRELSRFPKSVFLKNEDVQQLTAFNLQAAIQNCIDIGSHLYAGLDIGAPGTYSEIFYELAEKKVITHKLLQKVIQMIGLRKKIAHDYEDVKQEKIFDILKQDLKDFELFIKQIVKYSKI